MLRGRPQEGSKASRLQAAKGYDPLAGAGGIQALYGKVCPKVSDQPAGLGGHAALAKGRSSLAVWQHNNARMPFAQGFPALNPSRGGRPAAPRSVFSMRGLTNTAPSATIIFYWGLAIRQPGNQFHLASAGGREVWMYGQDRCEVRWQLAFRCGAI